VINEKVEKSGLIFIFLLFGIRCYALNQ